MSADTEATKAALFGWELRDDIPEGTCDACSEIRSLPYAWPETEAWLCAECWHDATEIDRLRTKNEGLLAEVELLRVAASIVEKVAPYITDTHTGRLLLTTAWLDDFTNAEIDYLAVIVSLLEKDSHQ